MKTPLKHIIHDHTFWLSPERVIFWEEKRALILSDLHFGKTGHFRKAGIPVPQHVYKQDLQRLFHQVQHFQPSQLIVVGDLFHSNTNRELDLFYKWRKDHATLSIHLVKGNHDILKDDCYQQADIHTSKELILPPFSFLHDPQQTATGGTSDHYCFSGHLHPGIVMKGTGKQTLRFPCFYFGEDRAILPAFSRFTGIAPIEPKENEKVFVIVENKVVELQ